MVREKMSQEALSAASTDDIQNALQQAQVQVNGDFPSEMRAQVMAHKAAELLQV